MFVIINFEGFLKVKTNFKTFLQDYNKFKIALNFKFFSFKTFNNSLNT